MQGHQGCLHQSCTMPMPLDLVAFSDLHFMTLQLEIGESSFGGNIEEPSLDRSSICRFWRCLLGSITPGMHNRCCHCLGSHWMLLAMQETQWTWYEWSVCWRKQNSTEFHQWCVRWMKKVFNGRVGGDASVEYSIFLLFSPKLLLQSLSSLTWVLSKSWHLCAAHCPN